MIAVIDMDAIKYAAAAVGEKRTILVTHKDSGREMEFKNRTEFYGRNKKEGWLGKRNENRTSPFEVNEFEITDIQVPEPVENALFVAKSSLEKTKKAIGVKEHVGFVGEGESFRVEVSTILKYKGQRANMLRPVHLDAVSDYLVTRLGAKVVTGIEADDACVIECYGTDNVLCAIDKDAYGTPSRVFNPNHPEDGIVECDTFGKLWLNDKGQVKGYGRIFFYFQVANGDSIDNYKANSASKIKWAEKSAYNALKDCTNDVEARKALVGVYQHLYPDPQQVKGWRGDMIEVDWLYMLTENFNMARMMTSYKDKFYSESDVLNWVDGKLF